MIAIIEAELLCRVINDAMGKVLVSLVMPYMKTRSINTLRKEGALNITLKPEDMSKPAMDQARIELALASKVLALLLSLPLFFLLMIVIRCTCGSCMDFCVHQECLLSLALLISPSLHSLRPTSLLCLETYLVNNTKIQYIFFFL